MKKTKLLTSIAALALVLGLGACDEVTQEDTPDEGSETTETSESDTTEEEDVSTAYAIVGDFADCSWNEFPATDSIYFIPAGTEEYKVTLELPTAETLGWTPSFSVVEYGTWNRVIAYDQVDGNSTGVTGKNDDNNICVEGGAYDVVITLGETPSILVKETVNNEINKMITAVANDHNYNAESYYYLYQSDTVEYTQEGMASVTTLNVVQAFGCDVYATEDAIIFMYLQYYYYQWYYMDIELFVNNYETGKVDYYVLDYYAQTIYELDYVTSIDGTWGDCIDDLGDLAPYRYAFTVAETSYDYAYGNIESYAVDESALDALIATTVGNNYIWDDLFNGGGGWGDQYFGYPDYVSAQDIFYDAESYDAYYCGAYGQVFDFTFDDGGGWYYASSSDHDHVLYQEIMAYTDVYDVGKTSIPNGFEDFLS